jgi:hypothetical protein
MDSLGGRFTLIKVVLEGQPVYWMALAAIPTMVIDKLRKLTYNFIWSSITDYSRQHLCNWESLAKPKNKGGWGIRNIFHFNKALATNSLWRVLTKYGMWHFVIKDKYLPHVSVATWLRNVANTTRVASQIWRNLIKLVKWITHWLYWKSGSGHSIILGKDCIIGLDKASYLSIQLITHLNSKNIRYLFQARGSTRSRILSDDWISSIELDLSTEHVVEWDNYYMKLSRSGIQLQDTDDQLMWSGGDRSGLLTVKNVYTGITNSL